MNRIPAWIGGARVATLCALGAGLAVLPARSQEQVTIQVPASVVFQVVDLQSQAAAGPSLVSFSNAVLLPGNRLRISVRAEELDFLGTGVPAQLSFTGSNAQGGTAFNGQVVEGTYTTVYESNTLTLSGSVQIAWTLAPLGSVDHAGSHSTTLRWRLESVSGLGLLSLEASVSTPLGSAVDGGDVDSCRGTAACGRGSGVSSRGTRTGERTQPPP